ASQTLCHARKTTSPRGRSRQSLEDVHSQAEPGNEDNDHLTMRILVTGGAGYIGSHAVKLFLARGHDVWVYDNLSLGHRAAVPAGRLVEGDLSEEARLDHLLVTRRIEAVVHFAASTMVGESVTN